MRRFVKTLRQRLNTLFASAVLSIAVSTPSAAGPQSDTERYRGAPVSASRTRALPSRPPGETRRRLHVPDPVARRVVENARARASIILAAPECAGLVGEFKDRNGSALSRRLDALQMDVRTYLSFIVFIDDSRHVACTSGIVAFTTPNSRVVRICSEEIKRTWQQNPAHAVAAIIHEMLHTLGLGENPPSSDAITRRVLQACRDPR